MTQWPSQKQGGIAHTIGGMQWIKLFRRDRQGRRTGGVAWCVREYFECLEFSDGIDRVVYSWVRIRGMANKAGTMVGVCYRSPNQNEEADGTFQKQLRVVSQSLVTCSRGIIKLTRCLLEIAERRQSRGFLEWVDGNFLT